MRRKGSREFRWRYVSPGGKIPKRRSWSGCFTFGSRRIQLWYLRFTYIITTTLTDSFHLTSFFLFFLILSCHYFATNKPVAGDHEEKNMNVDEVA
jgi:hypothetical protein